MTMNLHLPGGPPAKTFGQRVRICFPILLLTLVFTHSAAAERAVPLILQTDGEVLDGFDLAEPLILRDTGAGEFAADSILTPQPQGQGTEGEPRELGSGHSDIAPDPADIRREPADPLDIFDEPDHPAFAGPDVGPGSGVQTQCIAEVPVRRYKNQAIQKIAFSGGWLQAFGSGGVSQGFLKASMTFAVPLSNPDDVFAITPSFRADRFQAPSGFDLPENVYDTGVELFYQKVFNPRLSFIGIFQPAIRSDFTTSDDALRLFGVAMLMWDCRPETLTMSLGAIYLGRADIGVLPIAGLTWTPHSRFRMDLKFPESRLSWRIAKDGSASETWSYLSAGFGGNTWAVTRQSGQTDLLSTRDLRCMIGVQQIVEGGGGWFAETGIAFARSIEYQNTGSDQSLDPGVLLQAGWAY
ncbi:MAG: hypothetical protein R3C49_00660 [Planctomycetaceae bacterium]